MRITIPFVVFITAAVSGFALPFAPIPKDVTSRKVECPLTKTLSMTFCWIPSGKCRLGSPDDERKLAVTAMDLKIEPQYIKNEAQEIWGEYATDGFWLGKFEVTQDEWMALMGEDSRQFFFHSSGKGRVRVKGLDTKRFPAESLSYQDCLSFIDKMNKLQVGATFGSKGTFSLPDPESWEYACRGGSNSYFHFGNSLNGDFANCKGDEPFGANKKGDFHNRPMPVGSYEGKANHTWGLCDMHGNVAEMCLPYSKGKYKTEVAVRGGSWNLGAVYCRSAIREVVAEKDGANDVGFRVMFLPMK